MLYKSCVFFPDMLCYPFLFLGKRGNVILTVHVPLYAMASFAGRMLCSCRLPPLLSVDGEKKNSCDVMQHI
jgi:hypothetical protein